MEYISALRRFHGRLRVGGVVEIEFLGYASCCTLHAGCLIPDKVPAKSAGPAAVQQYISQEQMQNSTDRAYF